MLNNCLNAKILGGCGQIEAPQQEKDRAMDFVLMEKIPLDLIPYCNDMFSAKGGRDMMTIKEFAALCRCNAQTLRYYDKIDLLKPVRVDSWTGYRYYQKEQAIAFVKIKKLQSADFSIEEIKALLQQSDQEVYAAFDRKIAEQEHKLERIRGIQQSYLKEKWIWNRLLAA